MLSMRRACTRRLVVGSWRGWSAFAYSSCSPRSRASRNCTIAVWSHCGGTSPCFTNCLASKPSSAAAKSSSRSASSYDSGRKATRYDAAMADAVTDRNCSPPSRRVVMPRSATTRLKYGSRSQACRCTLLRRKASMFEMVKVGLDSTGVYGSRFWHSDWKCC